MRISEIIDYDAKWLGKHLKESIISIVVDYPLDESVVWTFRNPKGFSYGELAVLIADMYRAIYENPEKFGVWGHTLDQLDLEGISVETKEGVTLVRPLVGS